MKYNANYDRWVSKDGLVYRYSKSKDKLILCNQSILNGYLSCHVRSKEHSCGFRRMRVNRLVWETFMGDIPDGYEIDHIDTNKENNNLANLKCVTRKENMNNPLTRKHISEARKGWNPSKEVRDNISQGQRRRIWSEFNTKFKEHFGFCGVDNMALYKREKRYYDKHKKFSDEI